MVDPALASAALFGLLLVPVSLASSAHPERKRRRPRGQRGPDYGAMAEIEENDIEQMLDGIEERRRRNGRRPIADELADAALRPPPSTPR